MNNESASMNPAKALLIYDYLSSLTDRLAEECGREGAMKEDISNCSSLSNSFGAVFSASEVPSLDPPEKRRVEFL